MCRARNIGYIVLLLAGVGGLPPESPLKGSSTLERTHYIHLQRIRQHDRRRAQREKEKEKKNNTHTHTREKREENKEKAPVTMDKKKAFGNWDLGL